MAAGDAQQEFDDFGLPLPKYVSPSPPSPSNNHGSPKPVANDVDKSDRDASSSSPAEAATSDGPKSSGPARPATDSDSDDFVDAPSTPIPQRLKSEIRPKENADSDTADIPISPAETKSTERAISIQAEDKEAPEATVVIPKATEGDDLAKGEVSETGGSADPSTEGDGAPMKAATETTGATPTPAHEGGRPQTPTQEPNPITPVQTSTSPKSTRTRGSTLDNTAQAYSGPSLKEAEVSRQRAKEMNENPTTHKREVSNVSASEFSHQQLTAPKEEQEEDDDEGWQTMPAYAAYDIYDDDNKLIAREHDTEEDEKVSYAGTGGAGKGYTRVQFDDDAASETSMDDNTRYLFKNSQSTSLVEMDDETRDTVSQMQATKDLLDGGQRIAYVGVVRLELNDMIQAAELRDMPRKVKKEVRVTMESMKMWAQKIMIRLYAHMDIIADEQVMIESLAAHGVMPQDLAGPLLKNSRVKNPMAASPADADATKSPDSSQQPTSPDDTNGASPPPYENMDGEQMPDVKTPNQLPDSDQIDIDLRWTVLCDLFLILIADSIYDARSRVLLERVGKDLEVPWIDICRFEKRVTDALEMQQAAEKENWNEDEHVDNRRKLALRRRYVMMGLATAGGTLVIGLSAGLMAPLIGAGLAAGFTAIGVGGTSGFLAGAGGAAIITTGAAASGGFMGVKAAHRRTGAVKTFEYRPLHNNRRVNLIVTISGWMTSTNDDVRLPYSTVDPVMGDIYSILWEPEMLRSVSDTINILATEAVTQSLQQVLGATVLMGLMAALQLPIVLAKLTYLVDNPWSVSCDRAWSAGLILADSLIDRNLGTRPITLVGYSLGARVIFSCLLELARKGAYGIVQNVYMFGSPIVVSREEYLICRTVVAGRFLNGYNKTDWILGYLFRLTSGGIRRVAGLASVDDVPGLENMDCTEFVVGHMAYRTAMPRLLRECGWLVESDEFDELADPDPDSHRERQREIINEIEEARKELEKVEAKKGKWAGIFGRKKKTRAEWEVYEENKGPTGGDPLRTEDKHGNNHGILFDVDAIRAELARDGAPAGAGEEEIQVKELQSTLPPMRLEVTPSPRDALRETKSAEITPTLRPGSFETATSSSSPGDRTPRARLGGFEPAPGPAAAPARWEDEGSPGGLQMTFDTAYEQSNYGNNAGTGSTVVNGHGHGDGEGPMRPDMVRSPQTAPNISRSNNPWDDDDDGDPDFGKEQEISMTFA